MLKKLAVSGVLCAAVTGSVLVTAPANADIRTNGAHGVLSGNQVVVPISVPIVVCGNAVAVIGHAGAGCKGKASVGHQHH